MTHDEIVARRLYAQGLTTAPFTSPGDAVRALVAMQAQEYAPAKWSIGERADGVEEASVDRAMADGTILRTHVLRPTWHFVARSDLRWLMEVSGPRVEAVNASIYRKLGLDAALLARCNDLIARALEGERHLSRREIAAVLERAGVAAQGQRLAYVVMHAELDRVVCSGAPRGKEQTYALFDERVPPSGPRDPEEALAELALRYFTTRGPATEKDFRWWSGLTAAQAKRGIAVLGKALEPVVVEGRTYRWAPADAPPSEPSPTAHLLQTYDEYVIAYSESRFLMDGARLWREIVGPGASYFHALILDGQLAGQWRSTFARRTLTIDVRLSREITAREREAVERVVARYGEFASLPASLVVSA